jgi:hypothetical protein
LNNDLYSKSNVNELSDSETLKICAEAKSYLEGINVSFENMDCPSIIKLFYYYRSGIHGVDCPMRN